MLKVKEDTLDLFYGTEFQHVAPFKTQLLKWIGTSNSLPTRLPHSFPRTLQRIGSPFWEAERCSEPFNRRTRWVLTLSDH